MTLTLAAMLRLGMTSVGTEAAALIIGPQQLERGLCGLHAAMTEDL